MPIGCSVGGIERNGSLQLGQSILKSALPGQHQPQCRVIRRHVRSQFQRAPIGHLRLNVAARLHVSPISIQIPHCLPDLRIVQGESVGGDQLSFGGNPVSILHPGPG